MPLPLLKEQKIDQLEPMITNVQCNPMKRAVKVIVQGYLQAETVAAKNDFSLEYLVNGDGSVKNISSLSPVREYMWLPRIGVNLRLPQSMDKVKWFGKGPYENYRDRNIGSMVGVFESTVDDLFEPYIVPQENGNRSETRWVEITDGEKGFMVTGDEFFEFSANKYDIVDIENADHLFQLQKKPYINLYIDQIQAGLGSASCGPDTLYKYRVKSEPHSWSFTIHPISVSK